MKMEIQLWGEEPREDICRWLIKEASAENPNRPTCSRRPFEGCSIETTVVRFHPITMSGETPFFYFKIKHVHTAHMKIHSV